MDKLKKNTKVAWLLDNRIKQLLEAFVIILIITDLFLLILISFIDLTSYTVGVIVDFDTFVCIVLFFEFILKLKTQNHKLKYIRHNWIDIVAMIPLEFLILISGDIFSFIRFIRIIRIARVFILLKKSQKNILEFLRKTTVVHGAVIFLFIIAAGTVSFFVLENGSNNEVDSYDDALWYVIVTITTVGYGDISPESVGGRMTGAIIMIVGVFLMSLLTASLSSIMIEKESKEESDRNLSEMKLEMEKMRLEMLAEIDELKEIIKKSK
ncbi:MAG: potassium channel family protein [Methanobacterium sp.]